MRAESKGALKRALLEALPTLRELGSRCIEPHLVWTPDPNGGWHCEYQGKPSGVQVFGGADRVLESASAEFARLFYGDHPEYKGLAGFAFLGLASDGRASVIPSRALAHLWRRHESFDIPEPAIEAIVDEFAEFVDRPTTRLRFSAQVLNFHAPTDRIELPDGLVVRRLSVPEVNEIHGGPMWHLGMTGVSSHGPVEFVIEGELEEPKVFGKFDEAKGPPANPARNRLDRAMLAFRTFKGGRIGYDMIRFRAVRFCPWIMPSLGYHDLYVPYGRYELTPEEVPELVEHARLMFGPMDLAMEMACSRLADAEVRLRPQDQVIDSVVGMEALLLAGIGDRKTELSFRFSLNYSTLFTEPEERRRQYKVAKDLYGLRSTIAHGSSLAGGAHRLGEEKVTLEEAAKRATETLRWLIRHFLPKAGTAPYKQHDFWEHAYFGFPKEP